VRLRQPIRDLLLAIWEVDAERIGALLPDGFRPLDVGGRSLVAVACFRNRLARLGFLPVPPYGEIDLRTLVLDRGGEGAVFVLAFFVPAVGLAAAPFGVPVKRARLVVSPGRVSAPSLDVSAEYTVGEAIAPGDVSAALSQPSSAYWIAKGGLRRMPGGYHGTAWRRAELHPGARFGPAARLGLEPDRPAYALYAPRAELKATLPARRVRD
jgi:hypothetical protein